MSGWYYMKSGVFSDSQIGPLSNAEFLQMAFDGKLKLKSKVIHPERTNNIWVFLEQIPDAKEHLDAGELERLVNANSARAAKESARREREASKKLAKTARAAQHRQVDQIVSATIIQTAAVASPFSGHGTVPQFHCPFCGSGLLPRTETKITTGGWILCIVLFLFLCWPLCWIGVLLTEENRICQSCGMKLA